MATINPYPQDWREARRRRAFALNQKGWKQRKISEALGVSEGAVSQWLTAARQRGEQALQARLRPGAPARITHAQLQLVPDFLSHGAEAYGFRGELWTCARVAKVIDQEFGVAYHKSHVSRLLKQLDWTPQKPIQRAIQRDEVLIESWRKEVWLDLKKRACKERRTLVFVDESGFYLLPAVARTYAPRGQTPILHPFQTHDHLSVMSGITLMGKLYTLVRDEPLTGCESTVFLRHLLQHAGDKLLVIWDGSPIHRAAPVKSFLAEGGTKSVHLEQLPAYAPDLNPDEGVWQHLKHVEMRNLCCSDLHHLRTELWLATMRLRNKPHLIRAFFAGAGLGI